MRFIGGVIEKLQRHPKRIVFPEGAEPRVLQAARQFYSLRLGVPILLGDRDRIQGEAAALNISLDGIRVINPAESGDLDNFARRFERLRHSRGMKGLEARDAMLQPNYFGAMMLAMHQADGFVAGANQITATVLRPLLQIIKPAPQASTISSCLVMELEDSRFGDQGVLLMADCGVIEEPSVESWPIPRFRLRDWPASSWARARVWLFCPSPPREAPATHRRAKCRQPRRWPRGRRWR